MNATDAPTSELVSKYLQDSTATSNLALQLTTTPSSDIQSLANSSTEDGWSVYKWSDIEAASPFTWSSVNAIGAAFGLTAVILNLVVLLFTIRAHRTKPSGFTIQLIFVLGTDCISGAVMFLLSQLRVYDYLSAAVCFTTLNLLTSVHLISQGNILCISIQRFIVSLKIREVTAFWRVKYTVSLIVFNSAFGGLVVTLSAVLFKLRVSDVYHSSMCSVMTVYKRGDPSGYTIMFAIGVAVIGLADVLCILTIFILRRVPNVVQPGLSSSNKVVSLMIPSSLVRSDTPSNVIPIVSNSACSESLLPTAHLTRPKTSKATALSSTYKCSEKGKPSKSTSICPGNLLSIALPPRSPSCKTMPVSFMLPGSAMPSNKGKSRAMPKWSTFSEKVAPNTGTSLQTRSVSLANGTSTVLQSCPPHSENVPGPLPAIVVDTLPNSSEKQNIVQDTLLTSTFSTQSETAVTKTLLTWSKSLEKPEKLPKKLPTCSMASEKIIPISSALPSCSTSSECRNGENAGQTSKSNHRNAITTIVIMLVFFSLSYTPVVVAHLLGAYDIYLSSTELRVCLIAGYVNSVVNPILIASRTHSIRRTIKTDIYTLKSLIMK